MTCKLLKNALWLVAPLAMAACATPPKPNELEGFERLKQSPNYAAAQRRQPELVADSERLYTKANDEWKDNSLEDSRRDSLMGSIKLKTALALVEYDQSKARADKLAGEQRLVDDEAARVSHDLQGTQEQIGLLHKLDDKSSQQQRLQAEMQTQAQAGTARDKVAAAEIALKGADQVNAAELAKVEYQSAQDSLARAQSQLKAGDYQSASQTADLAHDQATRAAQTAKPQYDAAQSSQAGQARNDALTRDLAGVPGAQVRVDRRGDVQRAAVPVRGLFKGKSTIMTAGNDGVLDALATVAKKYPNYNMMIVGYTDSRGSRSSLLALSQARATAVYSALTQRGVDAKRMVVSGNGADEPVSENRTVAGRALNNRVEVIFILQ